MLVSSISPTKVHNANLIFLRLLDCPDSCNNSANRSCIVNMLEFWSPIQMPTRVMNLFVICCNYILYSKLFFIICLFFNLLHKDINKYLAFLPFILLG